MNELTERFFFLAIWVGILHFEEQGLKNEGKNCLRCLMSLEYFGGWGHE